MGLDAQERFSDKGTVKGFGDEWKEYNQKALSSEERKFLFDKYFHIFPWDLIDKSSLGMDIGCGSGRWAAEVAPRVGRLICMDASLEALDVARENLQSQNNCEFMNASVGSIPVEDNSLDFAYSLGVLHHIPDTIAGLKECVKKLKPGAPFLVYLYYRFDNKPLWYVLIWRVSDVGRRIIANLPWIIKKWVCLLIAIFVYWPLARFAKLMENMKFKGVDKIPLSSYRDCSFYSMKTDALDRFGTRLEHRFTREEIKEMLKEAGIEEIRFSEDFPYWVAVGRKVDA